MRIGWCWAGALQNGISALRWDLQLEEAAKPSEHTGRGRGSWAASWWASSSLEAVQSPLRAVISNESHGQAAHASQILLWHFQAWDDMPYRSLPSLTSQPCRLPGTSAGCSMAQSRWVLGVPSLVACSCWMGSYRVNPATTGITLCYLHKGNNQHYFKIKYRKWDFWIKTR